MFYVKRERETKIKRKNSIHNKDHKQKEKLTFLFYQITV